MTYLRLLTLSCKYASFKKSFNNLLRTCSPLPFLIYRDHLNTVRPSTCQYSVPHSLRHRLHVHSLKSPRSLQPLQPDHTPPDPLQYVSAVKLNKSQDEISPQYQNIAPIASTPLLRHPATQTFPTPQSPAPPPRSTTADPLA